MIMRKIGAFIIMAGVVLMLIVGYNFVFQEEVANLVPNVPEEGPGHQFPWYPLTGAVLLSIGIILLVVPKKNKPVIKKEVNFREAKHAIK